MSGHPRGIQQPIMRTLGVATRRSAGKYAWSPTIQGTSACVGSISNGPTPMADTNTTFLVPDEARTAHPQPKARPRFAAPAAHRPVRPPSTSGRRTIRADRNRTDTRMECSNKLSAALPAGGYYETATKGAKRTVLLLVLVSCQQAATPKETVPFRGGVHNHQTPGWSMSMRKLLAVAWMLLVVLLACEEAAPPKPTAAPAAAPAAEPEPEPSTPTAPAPPPAAEPEPPPPAPTTPAQPDTGFSSEYDPPAWVRGMWRGTGATLEITSAAIRFSWNTGTDYVIPASQVYRQHTSTLPAYTVFKRIGAESEVIMFVTVSDALGSCARTTVNGEIPPASSCTTLIWRR